MNVHSLIPSESDITTRKRPSHLTKTMPKLIPTVFLSGFMLNIIGSLLPWGCRGDFISICKTGISIPYLNGFYFEDNGGLLIVVFSLSILALVFYKPPVLKQLRYWILLGPVFLLIYTTFNIGFWILEGTQQSGVTGEPLPAIGLWIVLVGSTTLLFGSIKTITAS